MTRGPVLILGADTCLTRACQDLGVRAVRALGPWEKDYVARGTLDDTNEVFVEDPARPDLVLAALGRAGLLDMGFGAVCVTSDAYVGAAGLLRAVLCRDGARCPDPGRSWLPQKDKVLQKRALVAAGIQVTPFMAIQDIWEPDAGADWTSFPAVVKPVAQQGSAGLRLAEDRAGLDRALAGARAERRHRSYLIERFIEGAEVHIDGVVSTGTLCFLSVGVYYVSCMTAVSGQVLSSRIADPQADPGLYALAGQLARSVLPVLSIHDGVFHLEAFRRGDGTLLFSECAARLGGAGVPEAIRAKFGVDLRRAYLQTELGLPLDLVASRRPDEVGWVVLPAPSGRLAAVPDVEQLRALPGVLHADIRRPVGAEISPVKISSTYGLGTAVIGAPSERALPGRISGVLDWCRDHTDVAPPDGHPPPAFLLWRRASRGRPSPAGKNS